MRGYRVWRRIGGPVGVLLFLLLWWLSRLSLSRSNFAWIKFLPSPVDVAERGWELVTGSDFWYALLVSNLRVLAAFVFAMFIGSALGLLTAVSERIRSLLQPLLVLFRYAPIAALVPLSIVFVGIGNVQKVVVLFFGTVFYVIVLVQVAILNFPATHIETARTLGYSRGAILRRVVLPGISPDLFDVARVSIGLTWSYLLVAEIVAATSGMGVLIIRAERFLAIDQMIFVTIVLAIVGLAYDALFVWLRPRVFRWLP